MDDANEKTKLFCNYTQSSIEFTKDWRLRENIENKIREEYPVKLFLPAEG